MENRTNITIEEWCNYYSVETSFVRSLNEHGLIELIQVNETYAIDYEHLSLLEKYMHLHYDLDVNMEGIEVISHLLQRVEGLQHQLKALKHTGANI